MSDDFFNIKQNKIISKYRILKFIRSIWFKVIGLAVICLILITCSACETEQDTTKSTNGSPVTNTQQENVSVSIGSGLFRSDKFHIEVQLPEGWAAAEGPQAIVVPHLEGQVSFNSWGQTDFWVRAVQETNPDGSLKSTHFSPGVVASQVPAGGAYVVLIGTFSPPITLPEHNTPTDIPDEYTQNDLSGLYQLHDWREDSATYAYYKTFYRHDSWLDLFVACSQKATDETVDELNDLLQSWRFDAENL